MKYWNGPTSVGSSSFFLVQFQVFHFWVLFVFFCFMLLLVGRILWNIESGPTSVGSLSVVKFQVIFSSMKISKLW